MYVVPPHLFGIGACVHALRTAGLLGGLWCSGLSLHGVVHDNVGKRMADNRGDDSMGESKGEAKEEAASFALLDKVQVWENTLEKYVASRVLRQQSSAFALRLLL